MVKHIMMVSCPADVVPRIAEGLFNFNTEAGGQEFIEEISLCYFVSLCSVLKLLNFEL